jgi:hypothetical protein
MSEAYVALVEKPQPLSIDVAVSTSPYVPTGVTVSSSDISSPSLVTRRSLNVTLAS